jgi:hypothetical protein
MFPNWCFEHCSNLALPQFSSCGDEALVVLVMDWQHRALLLLGL